MAMVDRDGDIFASLDARGTIFSFSLDLNPSSSAHTDSLIYHGNINGSVFGVGGGELPLDNFNLQSPFLCPDPWIGLGLADIDFRQGSELASNENLWELTTAPLEASVGLQECYSTSDYRFRPHISPTHCLPIENQANSSSNPSFNFSVPLPLLDFSTRDSSTTIPWDNFWSQSPTASSTISSQASPKSPINFVSTTSCSDSMSPILCYWKECGKTFFANAAFNHHLKYHIKPFHCPHCSLQQATKRLLNRHINERHFNTERYFCCVDGCKRSRHGDLGNGGRYFTREDNCRRHLSKIHGISGMGEELNMGKGSQARLQGESEMVDMDELTRKIRRGRKLGRSKA